MRLNIKGWKHLGFCIDNGKPIAKDDGQGQIALGQYIIRKEYIHLAQLWVAGYPVDRNLFYQNERLKRIPLPTYPFARERYWFQEPYKNKSDLTDGAALIDEADSISGARSSDHIRIILGKKVSEITGISPAGLNYDAQFEEMGIDSIQSNKKSSNNCQKTRSKKCKIYDRRHLSSSL